MLALFFTGLGLSMDAFSLSVVYGIMPLSLKKIGLLSFIVGILHFLMPNLGECIGNIISLNNVINSHVLVSIIFFILALQMFSSFKEEKEVISLGSFSSFLLFGFTVSLDSFSVGVGYGSLDVNCILAGVIFAMLSMSFTFCGLLLGKFLNKIIGKLAILFGSFVLLVLSIYYFFL